MSADTTMEVSARGRLMPPASLRCDRSSLTSFTGRVVRYVRRENLTRLTIRTDERTTESFTVRHAKSDPTASFLFLAEPFQASHWKRIEVRRGTLKPGMRATAWVCETPGIGPIIDWQPVE